MLRVGGLTRLSASDYPDKLAAVVYCQGCPWRCSYCHNGHLQPSSGDLIPWEDVLQFLEKRRGLLDAVVFSGGEPTLQASLKKSMATVKAMGFLIGLHTAGVVPRMLARVLPLVDWVGMDLKAPFEEHERVTQVRGSGRRAKESMDLIRESGVPHRFHMIEKKGSGPFSVSEKGPDPFLDA